MKHDDIIDSLAWAIQVSRDLGLLDTGDGSRAAGSLSTQVVEQLKRLPARYGGLDDDSPELVLFESDKSDEAERLRIRLRNALEDHGRLIARGYRDPRLERYIQRLQDEVRKLEPSHSFIDAVASNLTKLQGQHLVTDGWQSVVSDQTDQQVLNDDQEAA